MRNFLNFVVFLDFGDCFFVLLLLLVPVSSRLIKLNVESKNMNTSNASLMIARIVIVRSIASAMFNNVEEVSIIVVDEDEEEDCDCRASCCCCSCCCSGFAE